MVIEKIFDFLQFLNNNGQVQYFEPGELGDTIDQAVRDFVDQEYNRFVEVGQLSDHLIPLLRSSDIELTTGTGTIPADASRFLSVASLVGGNEYAGELRTPSGLYDSTKMEIGREDKKPVNALPRYSEPATVSLSLTGTGPLPAHFVELEEAWTIAGEAEIVPQDQWRSRLLSQGRPPSASHPVCRIYGNTIEVSPLPADSNVRITYKAFPSQYHPVCLLQDTSIIVRPATLTEVRLHYIKEPANCTVGYTVSSDGYSYTFNQANSIDIELKEGVMNEIMNKVLGYFGLQLNDQLRLQFERLKENVNDPSNNR